MGKPLRVLIVEDSEDDTKLLLRELRQGGYDPVFERVDTSEDMDEALERQSWDIVIADYVMPGFSGLAALELLKKKGIDLPFILMSGQIDEETVVTAMKAGAGGFVSKRNLPRIVPAVERELRDAQVRRKRREAEEALQKAYAELELRVKERTAELEEANTKLQVEIAERRRAEEEREKLLEQVRSVNERLVVISFQAEEQGKEAERRAAELEAIIESMAEGVIVTDPSGHLVRMNRMALALLGLRAPEEMYESLDAFQSIQIRRPDGTLLPYEEWPLDQARHGKTFTDLEVVIRVADGKERHLLFAGAPALDEEGRVILSVNVFRDISSLRELEQQREEFVSVVAHDLRNALTSMKGFAQLLAGPAFKETLPPPAQRPVEGIVSGTRRLERMIADLLDVSRIEARRLTLEKKPIDLPSLVRDIVQRSEELTKGHPVKVEVRGDIPQIEADPDRIEQVLTNLLSNAGKYSYPDTEITVEIERRGNEVIVSVTNLGRGVLPEDQERLFTRFHRTKQAEEEKVPGLGLGLYIAKGLVEAHGGRIWVESKPGEYATFCFTLPIEGPTS